MTFKVLDRPQFIPLYKNAIYLMGNALAMAVCGFFAWVIIAKFYSTEAIGLATAVISAIGLLAIISNVGFGAVIIRYLAQVGNRRLLLNTCLVISGGLGAVLALAFIGGVNTWSPRLGFLSSPWIAACFVVFTLFWSLTWLFDSVFVAYRRADFVFWKNNVFSLGKLFLPLLFVFIPYGQGIVVGWGIALLVGVLVSVLVWLPKIDSSYGLSGIHLPVLKSTWRYSLGSYLVLLLKTNPGLLLPLLVVNFLGAESNAYFYIVWMITMLLFSIPTAVSESLFAEGSHFEVKLEANTKRALKFTFLLLIPAGLCLYFLGGWVLNLFGQGYADNGQSLLKILVLSSPLVAVTAIYESTLRVKDKLRELNIITGFIAAVAILGGVLAMKQLGLEGIGFCWLGAHIVTGIYAFVRLLVIREADGEKSDTVK